MEIDINEYSSSVVGFLTSPLFNITKPQCFIFEYDVSVDDNSMSPFLEVYIRCKPNLYSGKLLWRTTHKGRGTMRISIPTAGRIPGCYMDFVGHLGYNNRNKVAVTNIQLSDNVCFGEDSVACPDGYFVCWSENTAICVEGCNGTQSCSQQPNQGVSTLCGEI